MTLDEAIKHAEEVAKENEKQFKNCPMKYDSAYVNNGKTACKCAKEHRQLAEWLKDYKRLLEQQPCERFEWGIDGKVYKITKAKDGKEICQQVCKDAISKQAMFEILTKYNLEMSKIAEDMNKLPPAVPQQKYGKWIKHPEIETSTPEYLMFYECSECGDKQCFCKSDLHKKRFCNSCGAKMQESEE